MDTSSVPDLRSQVFANSSLVPLKIPAFLILDAMQHEQSKAVQVDALFLTATLVALGTGIDPHDLIIRAKRQIADADATKNPHLEAIREYASGELK
jgi:hypothetical protein